MSVTTTFRRLFATKTTPMLNRDRKGRRAALRVDALETRVLMAASIAYDDGLRHEDYGWNVMARIAQIGGVSERPDLKGFHVFGSEGNDDIRVREKDGYVTVVIYSPDGSVVDFDYARGEEVPNIFIYGGGGNDTISANSTANNYIFGGEGNDTIFGGNGWEGLIAGEDGDDVLELGPLSRAEVYGGNNNDVLRGGRMDDHMYGGEGDDTLYGNAGMDFLYGDGGFDKIYGGSDPDFLHGGVGSDTMYGEAGDDILFGGPEINGYFIDNDSLFGGTGQDWLMGGEGADYLDGGRDGSRDVLQGQRGADTFKTNYANNQSEDINQDYNASQGDQLRGLASAYATVGYATTPYSISYLGSPYAGVATTASASNYASAYSTLSGYNTYSLATTSVYAADPVVYFAETYATGDYQLFSTQNVDWTESWVAPSPVVVEEGILESVEEAEVLPETTEPIEDVETPLLEEIVAESAEMAFEAEAAMLAEPEADSDPGEVSEGELMDPVLLSEEEYVEWSESEPIEEEYIETPIESEEAIELPVEEQELAESEILEETSPIEIDDTLDTLFSENEFVSEEAQPQTDESEFIVTDEWSESEWVAEEYVETPIESEEATEVPVEEQELTESEILEETGPIEIVDVLDDSFNEHEFVPEEVEPQTDDSEFLAVDSIESSEADLGEEQQPEEFILEEVSPLYLDEV